eukprot:6278479-Amphidinium_carterae.1
MCVGWGFGCLSLGGAVRKRRALQRIACNGSCTLPSAPWNWTSIGPCRRNALRYKERTSAFHELR